jgi:DnaJ-class molecular chaperone
MSRGSRIDHYGTLGVRRDASTPEIRRAYRRLARQHHPDLNPADDGGRFLAVTGAYEILSDPMARARYDRTLTAPSSSDPRESSTGAARRHRVGILELSLQEATHLAHHPLVIAAATTTIRLPAGTGHGDTIVLDDEGFVTVLHIRVNH